MAIYELDGQAPELPKSGNYFIAETATVIGKVRLLEGASAGSARCCAVTMIGSRSARIPMCRMAPPAIPIWDFR